LHPSDPLADNPNGFNHKARKLLRPGRIVYMQSDPMGQGQGKRRGRIAIIHYLHMPIILVFRKKFRELDNYAINLIQLEQGAKDGTSILKEWSDIR